MNADISQENEFHLSVLDVCVDISPFSGNSVSSWTSVTRGLFAGSVGGSGLLAGNNAGSFLVDEWLDSSAIPYAMVMSAPECGTGNASPIWPRETVKFSGRAHNKHERPDLSPLYLEAKMKGSAWFHPGCLACMNLVIRDWSACSANQSWRHSAYALGEHAVKHHIGHGGRA